MRLLTKTTLYFLAALVPLLVAAGFVLFLVFSNELNERMDKELKTEEIQWVRYLRGQAANGTTFILRTPEIIITPVDAIVTKLPTLETTTGYNAEDNRRIKFRQLTHVVSINGVPYLVTIRRSQEQRTEMVATITRIMLMVFAALFIITVIVNWLISRTVWKPFKSSLQKIANAELQKMETVRFEKSNIKEFNDLNSSLNEMTNKIHRDYISIKKFTEDAAHEMQTPVAVVQSKLELLLQDPNLTNEQAESILQASEALNHLGKLNQALLLLAKIENNQFETTAAISLTNVANKYLKLFDELIKAKQVTVQTNFTGDLQLQLHPFLADTLISNLLGNAFKYNYAGGTIKLQMEAGKFQVSNTSHLPPIDPEQLFKRFNKTSDSSGNSTGLGLAIVKNICDTHNLSISYHASNGVHHFTVEKN